MIDEMYNLSEPYTLDKKYSAYDINIIISALANAYNANIKNLSFAKFSYRT